MLTKQKNTVQKPNQNIISCSDSDVEAENTPTESPNSQCGSKGKLESVGNCASEDCSALTYYGVCLPSGSSCTDDEEMPLIFTDKKEALRAVKKYKGARFKAFNSKEEAVFFANQSPEQTCPSTPAKNTQNVAGATEQELNQGEKSSPFKAPRSQDLVKLRKFIESGDVESFKQTVWSNPRYLVSSGDTPAVLQEGFRYNALHVAAKCKQGVMCQVILDIIEDVKFMELLYNDDSQAIRQQRINFLTDLYINTPDKGLCETPLHFASKFGSAKIVEILLAHPACDRNRVNKYGKTPRDVICERCPDSSVELKKQIDTLFEERLYVPLLRSESHAAPPVIGKPWSPEKDNSLESLPFSSPRSPCEPQLTIKALAGPMSPKQAEEFYKQWKMPGSGQQNKIQARILHRMRLSDTDKGLERSGRELARKLKVPWSEYWEFLGCWCDLTSTTGLCKLENHLKNMHNKVMSEAAQTPPWKKSTNKISEPQVSPICLVPSKCHSASFINNSNNTGSSTYSDTPSPMSQLCRKLEDFHFLNSDSPSPLDNSPKLSGAQESNNISTRNIGLLSNNGSKKNGSIESLKVRNGKTENLGSRNGALCCDSNNKVNTNDLEVGKQSSGYGSEVSNELLCGVLLHNLTTALFEVASLLHEDVTQEASVYRCLMERSLPYLPTSFMQLITSKASLQDLHISVGKQLYEAFSSTLQTDEVMQFYRCLRIPLSSDNDALLSSDDEEDDNLNQYHSFASQLHYHSAAFAKQHLKCIFRVMCFHMSKAFSLDTDNFSHHCFCKLLPSAVPADSRNHIPDIFRSNASCKGNMGFSTRIPLDEKLAKSRHKHKQLNGDSELLVVSCHTPRSQITGSKSRNRASKRTGSMRSSLSDLSNDDVLTENEESDSDDVYVTPPSSASSTRSSTPQEAQTPEEGAEVFIQGTERSKLDLDVFRAIEDAYIDSVLYPHILRWKHLMGTYLKEDIKSWPTPSCLRRQSYSSSPSTNSLAPRYSDVSTPVSLQHHYKATRSLGDSLEPRNLYESFFICEDNGGNAR